MGVILKIMTMADILTMAFRQDTGDLRLAMSTTILGMDTILGCTLLASWSMSTLTTPNLKMAS